MVVVVVVVVVLLVVLVVVGGGVGIKAGGEDLRASSGLGGTLPGLPGLRLSISSICPLEKSNGVWKAEKASMVGTAAAELEDGRRGREDGRGGCRARVGTPKRRGVSVWGTAALFLTGTGGGALVLSVAGVLGLSVAGALGLGRSVTGCLMSWPRFCEGCSEATGLDELTPRARVPTMNLGLTLGGGGGVTTL